jgi:hypothetical protein
MFEWSRNLIRSPDPRAGSLGWTQSRYILTFEGNYARIRGYVSGNHAEERRLTGTVGADDTDRIALHQLEGDRFTNNNLAKPL